MSVCKPSETSFFVISLQQKNVQNVQKHICPYSTSFISSVHVDKTNKCEPIYGQSLKVLFCLVYTDLDSVEKHGCHSHDVINCLHCNDLAVSGDTVAGHLRKRVN